MYRPPHLITARRSVLAGPSRYVLGVGTAKFVSIADRGSSFHHPQLGRNPPVASVSLGAVRVFELRKKHGAPNFIRFPLFPGSLLLMEGAVQGDWLHCLPKDPDLGEG